MADRYWVGGTADWDGTAGTKWATTSGDVGGASVPTTADDVFFDGGSGAVTCTIATGNTGAKSINCTGFTGTITGTAAITVAGSITLVAGQTYTHTGTVTFSDTGTLTTAGKTFSGVTVNGVGITVTLGDALNISNRSITLTNGTFDTSASNYNVTASAINLGAGTKTLNLNASNVTLSGEGPFNFQTNSANFTFNAGTSTITSTTGTANVQPRSGGFTFYNVTFTQNPTGTFIFHNAGTYNNLTFATSTGLIRISLHDNQTINGTLTLGTANTAVGRIFIASNTTGTARTITVNGTLATLSDVDFRDITAAGTVGTWTGTRLGDCLGNTNITFDAPKTVYWNLSGSRVWANTGWAASSGGVPAVNNFPLAQDTAVFDDAGAAGTIGLGSWNIGTIDMSTRTTAFTLNIFAVSSPTIHGSITFFSNLTLGSGLSGLVFVGRGVTQTITSAGKTFSQPNTITIDNLTGTVQLADEFSSLASITLNSGTFNANNQNVTATAFASNNSNTRTLTMGSGTWTLSGTGTVWNTATTTNLTFNKDTANIVLTDTSTTARTFAGGGLTYNNLTIGGATGTSTLTITGANTFATLASTKTVAHTIVFPNVTTTVSNWTIKGTAGNVVTLSRTGASGTFTLAKSGGVVSGVDYLSISNSTASPTNIWYAGSNSINGGGNTNWLFTFAPSFLSREGDLETLFVTDYAMIDQYAATGSLWNWGHNPNGMLGDNSITHRSSPVQTVAGGTNWKLVAASNGGSVTAAIKTDGTLWLWGGNGYGSLGDNSTTPKSSPVQTVSGGTNWKQVSGGFGHIAAIKTDGTLWTWGHNGHGRLGDNSITHRSSPVQTVSGGTNWKQVAAAFFHTAAIKTDGTLWTWGYNLLGQLGDNTGGAGTHKSSPVQTIAGGTNWKQVAGGIYHTAAIKTDGTLWLWGFNSYGTLGDNTTTGRSSPVQTVAGGTNWKSVGHEGGHVAAIKTDGTLWTWGINGNGQLGDNTVAAKSSPIQTVAGGTNWKLVGGGFYYTTAIKTDGTLWTWGHNSNGQLGDNSITHRSSPIQTVAGGTNWKQVDGGRYQTAAIHFYEADKLYPSS